jgi:hypothetical protein
MTRLFSPKSESLAVKELCYAVDATLPETDLLRCSLTYLPRMKRICEESQSLTHTLERLRQVLDKKSWACSEQEIKIQQLQRDVEIAQKERSRILMSTKRLYEGCTKYLL